VGCSFGFEILGLFAGLLVLVRCHRTFNDKGQAIEYQLYWGNQEPSWKQASDAKRVTHGDLIEYRHDSVVFLWAMYTANLYLDSLCRG